MKKIIILTLLLTCGCSVTKKEDRLPKKESIKVEKAVFFASTPIVQFNSFECPCVNGEIEGKTYLLKLDLGFQGDMTIREEVVNMISRKTYLREHSTYGIRGKEYKKKLYQIPELNIGSMTFSPPILQEENGEFLKDSEFWQGEKGSSNREEEGRLGCSLFYNTNLFIDILNCQIAFCDSIDTLRNNGYPIETFVKTPLILEKGLSEIEVSTPNGPLRCILDTGSTWNILNAQLDNEESWDQLMWEKENTSEFSFFTVEGTDFGPTSFHRMPIRLPIQIEAVLGIEFFKTHLVFLDFSEKFVYISKK